MRSQTWAATEGFVNNFLLETQFACWRKKLLSTTQLKCTAAIAAFAPFSKTAACCFSSSDIFVVDFVVLNKNFAILQPNDGIEQQQLAN